MVNLDELRGIHNILVVDDSSDLFELLKTKGKNNPGVFF